MTMMLTGTTPTPLPLDQMKPWNSARQMLVCTSVTDEAPDVKTFTFAVEGGGWFNYMPGQFITVELRAKGGDLHRTYTVSSSPSRPYAIAITIKAQPTSIGTRWMFENVRPGSRVRAYGPSGHFTLSRNPGKKYLFISAGSGITPMMSMLRWLSDCAPDTDVVFINSARRPEEIIFREELELLAKRMPNLSLGFLPEARSVASPWSGLMGRIDRHKLSMLTPDFMGREIFCCGPDPFMRAVSAIVHAEGFDMGHYHQESFGATSIAKSVHKQAQEIVLEGKPTGVAVSFLGSNEEQVCEPGKTILETARRAGVRIPAACESGICGTCKVLKRSGEVEMHHNGGISDQEINAGYVLACCSRPTTPVEIEA
ncbi:hybrid-cluster NAD(P)-dependent oxidoreductase [Sinorhizobium fredii]|uniref:Hybrid-cluster NAD(P)-dependent oxidoreductase n=1 Tax=Rhizobium fredii TaxID=380 RepID=A0A2A6M352_RHIFR|nr:hybrid-cluster NAD(P)-dependent oxidoreductase [Sinorhizobium fredii]ASY70137.1 Flavodoxin reductases (ferredoxin-NADPH reductases) family 1 [Sinorhizobium fredii CCBAU 83666]PDT48997.1 hybrid-cluster NAD(P)-dependent oxidoreductase [Sinorhizobium fredii]